MSSRQKLPHTLSQPKVKQSAKILRADVPDESRTVVSTGEIFDEKHTNITEREVNNSYDSISEQDDSDHTSIAEKLISEANNSKKDRDSIAENVTLETSEALLEPSFGDLIQANNTESIDVADTLDNVTSYAENYSLPAIQPSSGVSIGAVLAQALRTNDTTLLETCLHTSDIGAIRATIQRLESSLAAKLIQKLAEKLHKRPGIAGNLMIWIQWTLVAHGGYLATQRGLVKSLAELARVIDERSRGLHSVLLLKGKLDMLEAQIEMRRSIQNHRRRDEEDDDTVIYVEGQESEEKGLVDVRRSSINGNLVPTLDEKSDILDEIPTTNGMIVESEDEEDYSSDDDNLIDDEAEETDSETTDEEDVYFDEVSNDGEEESDSAPPTKIARVESNIL